MQIQSFFPVMWLDVSSSSHALQTDVACENMDGPVGQEYTLSTDWGIINNEQLAELIFTQNTFPKNV